MKKLILFITIFIVFLPKDSILAQSNIENGKEMIINEHYDEAKLFFIDYIDQNPNDEWGYYYEAKALYLSILKLNYYDQSKYYLLIQSSIIYYTKAIEINPNFIEAYEGRGMAYAANMDVTNAYYDLEKSKKLKKELEPDIPDSFNVGLIMNFPNNWKITDQRELNKNETEFKGVVLTDPTAEQPGTMSVNIYLDNENKHYISENLETKFNIEDTTLAAFSKHPYTIDTVTFYRFYILNKLGSEQLSITAIVKKKFFKKYKEEIEAVVRSIRIKVGKNN